MAEIIHKVLAFLGAVVLIVCTAWGGSSLGTALANRTYPDKVNCETQFPPGY